MYTNFVRKIESYLDDIIQYVNNEYWVCAQTEHILVQEEYIRYELETYPRVVSNLFEDILSIKTEMDEKEDCSYIYDIESSIEELICLIKEYECNTTSSSSDDYSLSDYDWNPAREDDPSVYQEYLDQYFVSESQLRLANDIERANSIYSFIKESEDIISKEKILRTFPNTSLRALRMALSKDDILNYGSVYISADSLVIEYLSKQRMLNSISVLARDGSQHNISELFDYAQIHNNDFLADARVSNPNQLFSIVSYLFTGIFSFARPYFAEKGAQILTADDQLKKYVMLTRNYSIRDLLDYAKSKRIAVDNIVRVLTSFNNQYFIYNKERIIPIIDTGITEACKQQFARTLSKELIDKKCIAIRDLDCFTSLPEIKLPWTEWLVYSMIKRMNLPTISVTVSSSRFKDAIPIVAMVGEDIAENIREASRKHFNTDTFTNKVDNLNDLDLLLEDIIDFDVLEDII